VWTSTIEGHAARRRLAIQGRLVTREISTRSFQKTPHREVFSDAIHRTPASKTSGISNGLPGAKDPKGTGGSNPLCSRSESLRTIAIVASRRGDIRHPLHEPNRLPDKKGTASGERRSESRLNDLQRCLTQVTEQNQRASQQRGDQQYNHARPMKTPGFMANGTVAALLAPSLETHECQRANATAPSALCTW